MEEKKKELVRQLLNYFGQDKSRVKKLGEGCKAIGFPLNVEENIDSLTEHPEAFSLLITYSDLGLLGKLEEVLNTLKKTKE